MAVLEHCLITGVDPRRTLVTSAVWQFAAHSASPAAERPLTAPDLDKVHEI